MLDSYGVSPSKRETRKSNEAVRQSTSLGDDTEWSALARQKLHRRVVNRRTRSGHRLQLINHVVGPGELPGLVLAIEELPIRLHVKHPTAPFHKNSFNPDLILNRVRQTGGPGQVVSLRAVGNSDRHVHRLPLDAGLALPWAIITAPNRLPMPTSTGGATNRC